MGCLGFAVSYVLFAIVHLFQLVLALVVAGLYGVDLNRARVQHKYTDGKWVFAEVVAGLSALSALLFMIPFFLRSAFVPVWSAIIFVLWIALFGLFGSMYIREQAEGDEGVQRMKTAVWVDLANAILWLLSTFAATIYWTRHRERYSRFTGRAKLGHA